MPNTQPKTEQSDWFVLLGFLVCMAFLGLTPLSDRTATGRGDGICPYHMWYLVRKS